jgi:hypothetical protein
MKAWMIVEISKHQLLTIGNHQSSNSLSLYNSDFIDDLRLKSLFQFSLLDK